MPANPSLCIRGAAARAALGVLLLALGVGASAAQPAASPAYAARWAPGVKAPPLPGRFDQMIPPAGELPLVQAAVRRALARDLDREEAIAVLRQAAPTSTFLAEFLRAPPGGRVTVMQDAQGQRFLAKLDADGALQEELWVPSFAPLAAWRRTDEPAGP